MFHILQARSWKRRSLTGEQIMKSLFTGGGWQRNFVLFVVVCERCTTGLFPTVWIFPTGFSHRGFFHAGVWAHPAKLTMCFGPRSVCVYVAVSCGRRKFRDVVGMCVRC